MTNGERGPELEQNKSLPPEVGHVYKCTNPHKCTYACAAVRGHLMSKESWEFGKPSLEPRPYHKGQKLQKCHGNPYEGRMEGDWEKERKEFSQEIVPVLSSEDWNREGAAVSGMGVETGAIRTRGGRAGQVMYRTGDQ